MFKPQNVLLVENNEKLLRFLVGNLQRFGYEVAEVRSLQEALMYLEEYMPHIVIFDSAVFMNMDDKLVHTFVLRCQNVPHCIILMDEQTFSDNLSILTDVCQVVVKPFAIWQLLKAVRRVLKDSDWIVT